jgi:hypothetical protein
MIKAIQTTAFLEGHSARRKLKRGSSGAAWMPRGFKISELRQEPSEAAAMAFYNYQTALRPESKMPRQSPKLNEPLSSRIAIWSD